MSSAICSGSPWHSSALCAPPTDPRVRGLLPRPASRLVPASSQQTSPAGASQADSPCSQQSHQQPLTNSPAPHQTSHHSACARPATASAAPRSPTPTCTSTLVFFLASATRFSWRSLAHFCFSRPSNVRASSFIHGSRPCHHATMQRLSPPGYRAVGVTRAACACARDSHQHEVYDDIHELFHIIPTALLESLCGDGRAWRVARRRSGRSRGSAAIG